MSNPNIIYVNPKMKSGSGIGYYSLEPLEDSVEYVKGDDRIQRMLNWLEDESASLDIRAHNLDEQGRCGAADLRRSKAKTYFNAYEELKQIAESK